MHFLSRFILIGAMLTALVVQAQIPPQPGRNPNAVPPTIRPRTPLGQPGAPARPGTAVRPTPATPAGANAAGEAGSGMRADQAINASGNVTLSFPNTPLSEILLLYEELTDLKVIRDAAAEQATVSIDTTGELPKDKAIMFIEKSLLLNGYSFVPSGEGMVKLLAFGEKKPQTEGAPLMESVQDLPETDQVVNFVALLKYLSGEDAIKAIDQVIPRHSYGVITPVPNAKALVITENSATIRAILALLERLDNKPTATTSKTYQLVRSDAEDVKKALDEILGTDEKKTGSTPGSPNRPATPAAVQTAQGGVAPPVSAALEYSAGGSTTEIPPKIISIPRRNSLLVIATPEAIEFIDTLVEELDAASELRNFVSRTLNYLGVDAAMGIISDAISRTEGDGSGGGTDSGVNSLGQSGATSTQSNTNRTTSNALGNSMFGNSGMNSGFGNNSFGGGGMGGFGSSGAGASASLTPLREDSGPRSIVVGKTLLISDPTANSIFASGPPEHLRVLNEILDELDQRPQQIMISVVIGEMNLDNEKGLSVDSILRGALIRDNASSTAAGGIRGSSAPLLDPRAVTNLVGDAAAGGFGSALGSGLTLYGGLADGVDIIVKTLETNGNFRVMSRPSIFTMNNRAATITSGVSIPVATSTQGLLTGGTNSTGLISNVQYQPVVLSLQILPLINSEDELTLQISQENNEASATRTEIAGNEYPELSQQTLNTTVLVKNRATVLLGGLIRESKNNSKSGLPFISRIPLLGALAGSQSVGISRRELLIFIQPRIVHGMNDLPPTVEDAPGTSPFASEVQNLLVQEKEILAKQPAPKHKRDLGSLFRKLFNKDDPIQIEPEPVGR